MSLLVTGTVQPPSRSHLTRSFAKWSQLPELTMVCFFFSFTTKRVTTAPLVHLKLPRQGLRNTMFSLVGRWSNLWGEIWPHWSLNNTGLLLGIRNWLRHLQPLSAASFLSSCPPSPGSLGCPSSEGWGGIYKGAVHQCWNDVSVKRSQQHQQHVKKGRVSPACSAANWGPHQLLRIQAD